MSREYIDANIDGSGLGRKKVDVFNIGSPSDKQTFEDLINDPNNVIIEESAPSVDKAGRVLVTVKWIEKDQ